MSSTVLNAYRALEKRGIEGAAIDLFTRASAGHMDPFLYSVPLFPGDKVDGANIWAAFLQQNPDYLICSHEERLISEIAPILDRFSGKITELIDFGAGSIAAFNAKTLPLLDRLGAPLYRPVDLCQRYLNMISAQLRDLRPNLRVSAEQTNFLTREIVAASGPAWLSWLGSSFSNIPASPDERLPLYQVEQRLLTARLALPFGGYCLISLDTTNDRAALMRAYDHPLGGALTLNLLHQIARDCPAFDIDPTAWDYVPIWRPELYLLEHRIISKKPQVIRLPNKSVCVATGESFVTDHSYKLPASIFERAALSVGWRSAETFGKSHNVQLLLLTA